MEDAYIVMPNNAPIIKQNMVKEYGGKITFCEPTLQSREETAAKIEKETGAAFIHPYNNENVIYGQGTQGIELIEDCPDLDCILVPIGGGGMISGITLSTMNFPEKRLQSLDVNRLVLMMHIKVRKKVRLYRNYHPIQSLMDCEPPWDQIHFQ